MVAEEYLNPGRGVGATSSTATLNTPVDTPLPPSTPTQKFFPNGNNGGCGNMAPPPYSSHTTLHHRNSRYRVRFTFAVSKNSAAGF